MSGMEFFTSPDVQAMKLPFAEAVRVGDVFYLSGQMGIDFKTGKLVPGGMEAEARQIMENIGAVLKKHGLGYGDIFKCTVMLADMAKWSDFNKIYVTYFPSGRYPTRSAFGAAALAMGGQAEVECWAYAGKR